MIITAVGKPSSIICLKLSVKTFCEIRRCFLCNSLNLSGRSFQIAQKQEVSIFRQSGDPAVATGHSAVLLCTHISHLCI